MYASVHTQKFVWYIELENTVFHHHKKLILSKIFTIDTLQLSYEAEIWDVFFLIRSMI